MMDSHDGNTTQDGEDWKGDECSELACHPKVLNEAYKRDDEQFGDLQAQGRRQKRWVDCCNYD